MPRGQPPAPPWAPHTPRSPAALVDAARPRAQPRQLANDSSNSIADPPRFPTRVRVENRSRATACYDVALARQSTAQPPAGKRTRIAQPGSTAHGCGIPLESSKCAIVHTIKRTRNAAAQRAACVGNCALPSSGPPCRPSCVIRSPFTGKTPLIKTGIGAPSCRRRPAMPASPKSSSQSAIVMVVIMIAVRLLGAGPVPDPRFAHASSSR